MGRTGTELASARRATPVFPFIGTEINWFGKPELAMPAVVIAALWISIGYAMVSLNLGQIDRPMVEEIIESLLRGMKN